MTLHAYTDARSSMLALGLILMIAGCGANETPSAPAGKSAQSPIAAKPSAPAPVDTLAHLLATQRAEDATLPAPVNPTTALKSAIAANTRFAKLAEAVYSARDHAPMFTSAGADGAPVDELIRMIEELPSHGVSLQSYPLESIRALRDEGRKIEARMAASAMPTGKAADAIQHFLEEQPHEPPMSAEEIAIELQRTGLSNEDVPMLEATIAYRKTHGEGRIALQRTLRELELKLFEGLTWYICEFCFSKSAHPFRAMRNPASAPAAFHDRIIEGLATLDTANLEETLQGWWPKSPLYLQSRVGLAHYTRLATEVTQVKLSRDVLKQGMTAAAVSKLQQRLQQEGYYADEITGFFGEVTLAAMIAYQRAHQLDPDGVVGGGTIRSLNVPFQRRADQIRLSLQRWRESESRWQDGFFIRVNIPQFRAEFWENATLERAHSVVVGSNAWEIDTEKHIEGHLNRTTIFSDEVELIVLNPIWHVPKRIKDTELDVALAEDPDYYEANHFSVTIQDDGTEIVSQDSGPWNALGLAKILFPNEHSIYMHDTPKKHLFKNTIRAYSHGCLRVENAVMLAEYLLTRDGRLESAKFKQIMKDQQERGLQLRTKIPIHVEYNTVSVNEAGHMMFLLDVYGYDKAYFAGEVPIDLEPKSTGT
jgi:murein L,D-transpeptidase YcbB/YkuD